ncbi:MULTISPECIES: DUF3866 family protein [unclassified Paenibacillus]|uniref:DUF3866 family protein n=1 Tax=unclassified Paenibacillus TaxID=185978 RepID=UPI001FD797F8|nr:MULTISPECIES: DUF3866 family protein [unclassified Paenibacillus]
MMMKGVVTIADCNGASGTGQVQIVQVLQSDGATARAIHDLTVFPKLVVGDTVLMNTTAESLGLGTGGYHFIHAILEKHSVSAAAALSGEGHIMKLRYTSLQRAVLAAEEPDSPHHKTLAGRRTLERMPVLIGELHSMLPAAVCWLRQLAEETQRGVRELRIAYIMTDGGALPLSISRHAARLSELGWLAGTVTYGHAYGGDLETVNKFTALLAARHVLHCDIAIVIMGPGIVGTGTIYGCSGLEVGELINAVHALKGVPVIIPRISFADPRERHRGISHHTLTALTDAALTPCSLNLPLIPSTRESMLLMRQSQQYELGRLHRLQWMTAPAAGEMEAALKPYGEPITSMGRGLADDPAFFAAVCCAASAAYRQYLKGRGC